MERHAGQITPGQKVQFTVEAFPGRTFAGTIAFVGPAVDQATRTFPVEALVDNANGDLKPGFFAKAAVGTRLDEHVAAVPEDAIITMAGVSTVFVIENGKVRQQPITPGEHVGPLVEVVDGLKGSETLASSSLNLLATGTPVRPDAGAGAPTGTPPGGGRAGAPAGATKGGAS